MPDRCRSRSPGRPWGAAAITQASPLMGATAIRVPTMSSAAAPASWAASAAQKYETQLPASDTIPPGRTRAWVLGVQPPSLVIVQAHTQHGLDAALIMQRQPTQGFLVCHGDHPLGAATGNSNRCVAAGEHEQQAKTSSQQDERATVPALSASQGRERPGSPGSAIQRRTCRRSTSLVTSPCGATGTAAQPISPKVR
jgi:hypothetical protein